MNKSIELLEQKFAEFYGVGYTTSFSSGTSAYLAALLALQLPPRAEVILAAYGWPQALAAPQILRLRVRMVDTDVDGRITPEAVAGAITPRTGAIIICHLFGNPADAAAISTVAAAHGVPLIEDCSQALMASLRGRRVGTWGQFGFASLGKGKLLSAGEGGLLWTDSRELHKRAFEVSQHCCRGHNEDTVRSLLTRSLSLRMHPAGAEMALEDLENLTVRARRVSGIHEVLRALLHECPKLRLVQTLPDARPVWQHFPVVASGQAAYRAIEPLAWQLQPAYLLSDSRRHRNATAFGRRVHFIRSGREWEFMEVRDAQEIAARITSALSS